MLAPKESPLELTKAGRDVSVTERGNFRTCRRRWLLETIDNWTPKAPTWALDFGTGIHSALEQYYIAGSGWYRCVDDNPLDIAQGTLTEWYKEMDTQQAKILGPLYTDEAKNELWELNQLGQVMLRNYDEYSRDLAQKDPWEILAVEGAVAEGMLINKQLLSRGTKHIQAHPAKYPKSATPFVHQGRILVPIVHPKTHEPLPGTPYLSARIDLIVRRKGWLWVVDHKTTSSSPSDKGLDFEDQITGYSYVVWRLTGLLVRGTIFNYLVKQVAKDPRYIQPTKDNPKGLSAAKDQLCLARDYRQALIDTGLMVKGRIASTKHADCYNALLATGWDPYFKRFEPKRNMHEVLDFEVRLYEEYKDMREVATRRFKAYPNPSTWHCSSCSVAPICLAMMDGSDAQGIIKSRYMQAPDRKAAR